MLPVLIAGGKKEPEDATLNKYSLEAYVKTMGPWAIYTILYPFFWGNIHFYSYVAEPGDFMAVFFWNGVPGAAG